jgi:hypothetical protein
MEQSWCFWVTATPSRWGQKDVQQQRVSANLFHVLGVLPQIGREFRRQEGVPGGPPLTILSHGLWQRDFSGDPRRRTMGTGGCFRTSLRTRRAVFRQRVCSRAHLVFAELDRMNARQRPGLAESMRRALQSVDPRLPFFELREHDGDTRRIVRPCCLPSGGVHGLVAQSVSQRTREMGIRLALGATTRNIVRTAAAPGIALTLAGSAAGLLLSVFSTRLLKSLIWGVSATDPVTLGMSRRSW